MPAARAGRCGSATPAHIPSRMPRRHLRHLLAQKLTALSSSETHVTLQKFSVYGNCQADALMTLLHQSPSFKARFDKAKLSPCFQVKAAEMKTWAEEHAADLGLLVHQKLRAGWRKDEVFDTSWLRSQAPPATPTFDWSDMYYKAYEPHMAYPLTFPRKPPSDYLNLFHVLAHANGLPWQAVLPLYTEADAFPLALVEELHRRAQADLTEREEGCALRIAPYVTENWREKRLFHTFNHPAREVMHHAARQVLAGLGLPDDIPETGWHVFLPRQSQPLPAAFEAPLRVKAKEPFAEAFSLRSQHIPAEDYFGRWEATLEAIGRDKLQTEIAAQAKKQSSVAEVLAQAARRLGVTLTL